ncbi:MAG: tetratricopeptide repeat protein [Deltaproteobacteria bacterium]
MVVRNWRWTGFFAALLAVVVFSSVTASAADRRSSRALSRCIMGGYYEKTGEIDKAIEEYKKALVFDGQNAYIHISLASAYLKKNDADKATEELTLASKFDPEAVEPHAVLALLYFTQNKPEEAGREYGAALEKASRLEPKNATIYKSLAALYAQQNNLEAAERTYKIVIGLSPDDHEAYFFLASVYGEMKNRAEELANLKKALELKPDYHPALNYLGYVYVEENRNLTEARKLIDRALELDPDNGAYIDSRGWLRFKMGKYKEAVADLEKASSLIEDPVVFDHLGDAYNRVGDREKAKASWKKALELDPKQELVKDKLSPVEKPVAQQAPAHMDAQPAAADKKK